MIMKCILCKHFEVEFDFDPILDSTHPQVVESIRKMERHEEYHDPTAPFTTKNRITNDLGDYIWEKIE